MPLDDQNELFYLVDENDQVIGSFPRSQAHDGTHKIHRAVFVLLKDQDENILLQKRSMNKDTFPGFWTVSVTGHVTYGLSYEEAAVKEMKEELGITTDLTMIKKYMVTTPIETEFNVAYAGTLSNDTQINFDREEISEVKWTSVKQINEMKNELTPSAIRCLYELGYIYY